MLHEQPRDPSHAKSDRLHQGRGKIAMPAGKSTPYYRHIVLALTLLFVLTSARSQTSQHHTIVPPSNRQLASPEIERKVSALLGKMTVEEKLGQLVQYNTVGATSATVAAGQEVDLAANPEANYRLDPMQLAQAGKLGSMLNVTGGARISSYQHAAVEQGRLHIPLLFGADVIHGYRTIYPVPLGLAASFDPQLVTQLSRMAAEEATTAGIRWFYSPMVDIPRDARWGRTTEGAGEDPYLGPAMMSPLYDPELPSLIKSGRVSMAMVDESVRRVLRVKFALGLFENPYPTQPEVTAAVPEHRPLVRQAAEESFVLLQNKSNTLPLAPNTKIALIGPLADNPNEMQGSWAGGRRTTDVITLKTALEERAATQGSSVTYAQGTEILSTSASGFAAAEAVARQCDVVILALGESSAMSGEAGSRAQLDLPGNQQALLDRIAALNKPTILIVFSGRPLVLTHAATEAQSILEAWFPGTEAGHALTRVLYGDVSPTGKLPMSFPETEGQEPLYYNQMPTGRPANNADLSHPPGPKSRFISRYIDAPNAALFPFGFGLSYTTFSFSGVTLSRNTVPLKEATAKSASLIIATTTVTNTGKVSATEVVQCYLGNRGASLEQPVRSLQGFLRVTLAPGESKQVSFPLGFSELSFFDNSGRQVIEPTEYTVWIGGDSLASNAAHFGIER